MKIFKTLSFLVRFVVAIPLSVFNERVFRIFDYDVVLDTSTKSCILSNQLTCAYVCLSQHLLCSALTVNILTLECCIYPSYKLTDKNSSASHVDLFVSMNSPLYFFTPDLYRYINLYSAGISMIWKRSIIFEVKACRDVHVALMSTQDATDPLYEIVVGGWNNTKSVIRIYRQQSPAEAKQTGRALNCNVFTKINITYVNGIIKLGYFDWQTTTNKILAWTDMSPLDVKYLGISSGFGSTAEWRFL